MEKKQRFAQFLLVLFFCGVGAFLVMLPSVRDALKSGLIKSSHRGQKATQAELSTEIILDALATVEDPGIPISVVDLGLVRDVVVEPDGQVKIRMILTSPFCPLEDLLTRRVESRVREVEGVKEVDVQIDRTAVWEWDMMTDEGKRKLQAFIR
jgi:metal-sulfur cluster biosynthetic enzyme